MAKSAYHEPLREGDSAEQTVGCRHTSPDICKKHSMPGVCAFVRDDGVCLSPPLSWPEQFKRLKMRDAPEGEGAES